MSFLDILSTLAMGVGYTVLVTIVCNFTGMLTGIGLVGLRKLDRSWLNVLIDLFVYVFQAVPMLVLLFIVYFGLPGFGLKVSPLVAMALSLGLIAGAYLAEVLRGALNSVDPDEILAAQAAGLSKLQILLHIELPQMLRFSSPGMINEFTTVLKYSPFAYTVGIPEITNQSSALVGTTGQGLEIYAAAGILYFSIYRILLAGLEVVEGHYRVPGVESL